MFKKFLSVFISVLLLMSVVMATTAFAKGNLCTTDNLARGASVSSDYAIAGGSSGYTQPAWNSSCLVDGSTSNAWGIISHIPSRASEGFTNPGKNEGEPSFVVDLGGTKNVDTIGLYPHSSYMTSSADYVYFEILGSVDGVDYTELYDSEEEGLDATTYPRGKLKTIYLDNVASCRYIKFQGKRKTEYRFTEFYAYGLTDEKNVTPLNSDPETQPESFIYKSGNALQLNVKVKAKQETDVWAWAALYDADENLVGTPVGLYNLTVYATGREYTGKSFGDFYAQSDAVEGEFVVADKYKDVKKVKLFVWDKDDMTPVYCVERSIEELTTASE